MLRLIKRIINGRWHKEYQNIAPIPPIIQTATRTFREPTTGQMRAVRQIIVDETIRKMYHDADAPMRNILKFYGWWNCV